MNNNKKKITKPIIKNEKLIELDTSDINIMDMNINEIEFNYKNQKALIDIDLIDLLDPCSNLNIFNTNLINTNNNINSVNSVNLVNLSDKTFNDLFSVFMDPELITKNKIVNIDNINNIHSISTSTCFKYFIINININLNQCIIIDNLKHYYFNQFNEDYDIIKLDPYYDYINIFEESNIIKTKYLDLNSGIFMINKNNLHKFNNNYNVENLNLYYLKYPLVIQNINFFWKSFYNNIDDENKIIKQIELETKIEETKIQEIKTEETKIEEIKSEETKTEETKIEEIKTEETKIEEIKTEETKIEETKIEETKTEDINNKLYLNYIKINKLINKNNIHQNGNNTHQNGNNTNNKIISLKNIILNNEINNDEINNEINNDEINNEINNDQINAEDIINKKNIISLKSIDDIKKINVSYLRFKYFTVKIDCNIKDYIFIDNKDYYYLDNNNYDIIKINSDEDINSFKNISSDKLIKSNFDLKKGIFVINKNRINHIIKNIENIQNINKYILTFPLCFYKDCINWQTYYNTVRMFKNIYCLHVNKDIDRLNNMIDIANIFNKKYDKFFWNGISGFTLPLADELFKEKIIKTKLRQGELGCNLSQQLILENAKNNNYESILMLEDDICIDDNFFDIFYNLIKSIEKIDIVQIGFSWNMENDLTHLEIIKNYKNFYLAKVIHSKINKPIKIAGFFCTYLSNNAINAYLKENVPLKRISDVLLCDFFHNIALKEKYNLECYYIINKNKNIDEPQNEKQYGLVKVNKIKESTTFNIKNNTKINIFYTNLFKYLIKIKKNHFKLKNNMKIHYNVSVNAKKYFNNIVSYVIGRFNLNYNDDNDYNDDNKIKNDIYIYTDTDNICKVLNLKNNENTLIILIKGEPKISDPNYYDICIGENFKENLINIPYPFMFMSLNERRKQETYNINFEYKKDCCFMYDKNYKHRNEIFKKISSKINVESLGRSCNNVKIKNTRQIYNSDETYNDIAVKIYSEYKFVLAIENTIKDYYFTEKIINPILANSIPIYYGTNTVFEVINKKRVIYFNDYDNIDELILYIKSLLNNKDKYNKILSEPIFISEINQNNYNEFLYSHLDIVLGFNKRIFSSKMNNKLSDTNIIIKINEEEKYYLKDSIFECDIIENYTQFKPINKLDEENSILENYTNINIFNENIIPMKKINLLNFKMNFINNHNENITDNITDNILDESSVDDNKEELLNITDNILDESSVDDNKEELLNINNDNMTDNISDESSVDDNKEELLNINNDNITDNISDESSVDDNKKDQINNNMFGFMNKMFLKKYWNEDNVEKIKKKTKPNLINYKILSLKLNR